MLVVTPNDSIADFYSGKSVFITGGTGFLGKVFIEKLLYSCEDLDKIYMLIREKKGVTINQRLKSYFDDPLFERLKNKRPKDLEKVIPISGDIDSPNLGISHENEQILIDKVSMVIHAAAVIKFNEPLKIAWRSNVEGTQMMLELAQRMKRVEVFVHISTAYTNTNREVIEEILYPPPADINQVCQLLKHDLSEKETLKIINGRPNTYTFTKALTEHLVAKNQDRMPTIIVRPSVVAPIKNDPIKGWLQNWFGATGITTFTAKGLNRVIVGHKNNIVDLIPVDYVANLVIAAGAKDSRSTVLKIYNACSSGCNPVLLGRIMQLFTEDVAKHKGNCMPLPGWYCFTKYTWLATIITFLFQIIPAYLLDIFRRITRQEPFFVKLQSRVVLTRKTLHYFTRNSWIMKADRTRDLFSSLSPSDKKMFPCDPTTIEWKEYLQDYSSGVRRFLEGTNSFKDTKK